MSPQPQSTGKARGAKPKKSKGPEVFATLKPHLTANEAQIEASRCLFCFDAPCVKACPTTIDVPMFIRQIQSRNPLGAAKTILSQNILGHSCGHVCPTEVLCEGACVFNQVDHKPIDIGRLQKFATATAISGGIQFFKKGTKTGKKVAVIGAGPAGLACAHELTRLGHEVTIFEKETTAGGLNRYGVAPYKIDNDTALEEVDYIQKIGFQIKTGYGVGSSPKDKIKLKDLEKSHDAIFLGIGLGASSRAGIQGDSLPGVVGAAEFIHDLRDVKNHSLAGSRVLVIGAGNTAIDASVESAKLGGEVTLVYRRSPEEQSAYSFEVELARQNHVRFVYLASPLEIIGTKKVVGVRFIRNRLGKKESSGKSAITPIKGSEFQLDADLVILATGQEKRLEFLKSLAGVELDDKGRVKVNAHFQTKNPRYFAGGDCVNGGKEVVNGAAHGRDAARGIHQYLTGKN